MAQYGRPDSDIATGNWTATPLWQKIDETPYSDSDYIEHNNTSESWCEMGLTNVTDPAVGTGHVVRYRARKFENTSLQPSLITFEAKLFCGSTEIAGWNDATSLTTSWQTFEHTLTEAEANAITDYSDLRIHFYGDRRTQFIYWRYPGVSWMEFECPDAAGPTPGWNKLAYTSEPPTPNAWNQLKRDAGTGWKQLKYEGE